MLRAPVYFFFLLFFLLASYSPPQAADRGLIFLPVEDKGVTSRISLYKRSYALVIGIDKYLDPSWPSLSNAINDAVAITGELEKRGFEVSLRKDLNSRQLKKAIEDFIYEKGRFKDARLFIWYAGHGHTIEGEGYLVPSDAPSPNRAEWKFRRKSLSLRRFGEFMREARAKHVMTIFDSCFSGTVFSSTRSRPSSVIRKSIAQKVRQFVSSGEAEQEVSDDGTFRKLFVEALNGTDARADQNRDGYLLGSELGLFLHQEVTNLTENLQTPRYGKMRAHGFNRGDFVFRVGVTASAGRPISQPQLAPKTSGRTKVSQKGNGDDCITIGRNIPQRIKLEPGTRFCDQGRRNQAKVIKIFNRGVRFSDNGQTKTCAQGQLCAFDWPVKPLFRVKARADAAKGIAPEATMLPR